MRKLFAVFTIMAFAVGISFNSFAADNVDKAAKDVQKAKTQVSYQALPDSVKTAVGKVCPEPDIKNITKEDYMGKPSYEIACTKKGKTHYFLFAEDGKLITKGTAKKHTGK
jgi:hypothetical protein